MCFQYLYDVILKNVQGSRNGIRHIWIEQAFSLGIRKRTSYILKFLTFFRKILSGHFNSNISIHKYQNPKSTTNTITYDIIPTFFSSPSSCRFTLLLFKNYYSRTCNFFLNLGRAFVALMLKMIWLCIYN